MEESIPRRIRARGHMDLAGCLVEAHPAIDQSEQRPIASRTDVLAGMELGSILADDDATRSDELGAKRLDAKSLAVAVTTVSRTSLSLLVSHLKSLLPKRLIRR